MIELYIDFVLILLMYLLLSLLCLCIHGLDKRMQHSEQHLEILLHEKELQKRKTNTGRENESRHSEFNFKFPVIRPRRHYGVAPTGQEGAPARSRHRRPMYLEALPHVPACRPLGSS